MWRLYLQKYSGSINSKNYLGQEVVGRFRTVEDAQKEINTKVKQAAKDGYDVLDASYFTEDHRKGFTLIIGAEDETTSFSKNPSFTDAILHNILKGGSVNAG